MANDGLTSKKQIIQLPVKGTSPKKSGSLAGFALSKRTGHDLTSLVCLARIFFWPFFSRSGKSFLGVDAEYRYLTGWFYSLKSESISTTLMELNILQFRVFPTQGVKFGVGSFFHDLAVFDDTNHICV